jgi:hypothetical protein
MENEIRSGQKGGLHFGTLIYHRHDRGVGIGGGLASRAHNPGWIAAGLPIHNHSVKLSMGYRIDNCTKFRANLSFDGKALQDLTDDGENLRVVAEEKTVESNKVVHKKLFVGGCIWSAKDGGSPKMALCHRL